MPGSQASSQTCRSSRRATHWNEKSPERAGQLPVDHAASASSVTFGWFVRKRYFLLKEADWTEETAKVKKFLIRRDLLNDFEDIPLVNLDTNSPCRYTSIKWP